MKYWVNIWKAPNHLKYLQKNMNIGLKYNNFVREFFLFGVSIFLESIEGNDKSLTYFPLIPMIINWNPFHSLRFPYANDWFNLIELEISQLFALYFISTEVSLMEPELMGEISEKIFKYFFMYKKSYGIYPSSIPLFILSFLHSFIDWFLIHSFVINHLIHIYIIHPCIYSFFQFLASFSYSFSLYFVN